MTGSALGGQEERLQLLAPRPFFHERAKVQKRHGPTLQFLHQRRIGPFLMRAETSEVSTSRNDYHHSGSPARGSLAPKRLHDRRSQTRPISRVRQIIETGVERL